MAGFERFKFIIKAFAAVAIMAVVGCDWGREEPKPTPKLHVAVRDGDKNEVERLIGEGVDVNEVAVGAVGSRGTESTPLWIAAYRNEREIAKLLITHGADVNKCSPLTVAIAQDNPDIAILLLDNGADINKDRSDGVPRALIAAAHNGDLKMAKLLIDRGIDLKGEPKDQFSSPMCHAAEEGHTEMVALLISKGVSVNMPRTRGARSPLHQAAITGHEDIVELLIAHGVELDRKDSDGRTALELAKARNYSAVVELLRKHGAKE